MMLKGAFCVDKTSFLRPSHIQNWLYSLASGWVVFRHEESHSIICVVLPTSTM